MADKPLFAFQIVDEGPTGGGTFTDVDNFENFSVWYQPYVDPNAGGGDAEELSPVSILNIDAAGSINSQTKFSASLAFKISTKTGFDGGTNPDLVVSPFYNDARIYPGTFVDVPLQPESFSGLYFTYLPPGNYYEANLTASFNAQAILDAANEFSAALVVSTALDTELTSISKFSSDLVASLESDTVVSVPVFFSADGPAEINAEATVERITRLSSSASGKFVFNAEFVKELSFDIYLTTRIIATTEIQATQELVPQQQIVNISAVTNLDAGGFEANLVTSFVASSTLTIIEPLSASATTRFVQTTSFDVINYVSSSLITKFVVTPSFENDLDAAFASKFLTTTAIRANSLLVTQALSRFIATTSVDLIVTPFSADLVVTTTAEASVEAPVFFDETLPVSFVATTNFSSVSDFETSVESDFTTVIDVEAAGRSIEVDLIASFDVAAELVRVSLLASNAAGVMTASTTAVAVRSLSADLAAQHATTTTLSRITAVEADFMVEFSFREEFQARPAHQYIIGIYEKQAAAGIGHPRNA